MNATRPAPPRLRSPILWVGGKGNMVAKLMKLLPPHREYVEVFGGGASLLFRKEPALVEVYNDIDSGLVNFFRVLRDPERFGQFYGKAVLTPYAREEFLYCRATWESCEDEVERAYRWFVVARMSFCGYFSCSWGSAVSRPERGMAATCSKWLSTLELLPAIHERMMRVQVEHTDWRNILSRYNAPTTLAYLDPPYAPRTRRSGKYKHELSDEDHKDIVDAILEYPGMVMLSGYDHEIYAPLEDAGWNKSTFKTACYSTARTRATGILGKGSALKKQPRTEIVWRNPAAMRAIEAQAEPSLHH